MPIPRPGCSVWLGRYGVNGGRVAAAPTSLTPGRRRAMVGARRDGWRRGPPVLTLDDGAWSSLTRERGAEPGTLAECSQSGGVAVYPVARHRPSRLMLRALALAGLLVACAAPTATPTPPNVG